MSQLNRWPGGGKCYKWLSPSDWLWFTHEHHYYICRLSTITISRPITKVKSKSIILDCVPMKSHCTNPRLEDHILPREDVSWDRLKTSTIFMHTLTESMPDKTLLSLHTEYKMLRLICRLMRRFYVSSLLSLSQFWLGWNHIIKLV